MTTEQFLQKLSALNACDAAKGWVATQPDAQTAWDNCDEAKWMEWYFSKTATPEMRAEYRKICGAAWAEYEKVSGAAWAKCEKVSGAAWAEYRKVRNASFAEYEKVCDAALAEYEKVCNPAWAEYNKVSMDTIRKLMPTP